jgi:hypothetical protein
MKALSRAAAAVMVAVGSVLVLASPSGAAPLTADPGVGQAGAAHWMIAQLGTDGLVPSAVNPSEPDLSATAHAVLALRQTGFGKDAATTAANALGARVDDFVVDQNGDNPANLALLILIAKALGQDPHSFGTTHTDLVARLEATARTTGPDEGLYGAGDPTYDGPFRQGLALSALSLVDPPAAKSAPVTWLLAQQCSDGSWMYRADLSKPCAFDPVSFAGPDTNATALAAMGLHAVGVSAPVSPLVWLGQVRGSDGGWSFNGGASSASDPDSTGLVIAADRTLGAAVPDGATEKLLSFQFGCDADATDRGAFWYPPFDNSPPTPNRLATHDATVGLVDGPWPASLTSAPWQSGPPADPCAPVATTTTSTAPPTTTTIAPATTTTTSSADVLAATADPPSSSSQPSQSLALTGSHDGPLALAGLALVAAGAALALTSSTVRRRTARR